MIKPFKYYVETNLVSKSIPNISIAKALIEKSEIRLNRISNNKIDESESSIVFEEVYECLREASQALMELKGYKPYSHEALISFLKENRLLSEAKVNSINNYRILRNNSVYQAEKISMEKCFETIKFAKGVLPEIKKKLKEVLK